jgi:hypothetical protein
MIPFLPELSASPIAPAAASSLPGLAGGVGAGAGEGGGRPAPAFAELLDAVLPGGAQTLPVAESGGGVPAPALPEPAPVMRPLGVLKGAGLLSPEVLPETPPPSGTALPENGNDLPPAGPLLPPGAPPGVPLAATAEAEAVSRPDTPQPEAALLALLPVATPPAPPATLPVPVGAPPRAGGAADPARSVPAAAPVAAAPRLPAVPIEPANEENTPASPALAAFASDAPAAASQPASASPAPAPAVPPVQPAPPAVPAPMAERAEPRIAAPDQESAIAQLGEIREALRSARPEMTLRHAEFGFVSLRIEGAAATPQDWRAVLASRDPGFVPAFQAALAERAVAASADTASTGNGAGQGGSSSSSSSDQRYGFSQGSGQGSSSPYPGQSGGRDEGASQDPRNPQQRRADDSAAATAGTPDSEASDQRQRGLFA